VPSDDSEPMSSRTGNQGLVITPFGRRQAHGSGILSFLESYGMSMPPRPGNQGVIAYHALWATRRQAHGSGILSVLKSHSASMPPRLAGRQGVIAYHALWATRRQAHGSGILSVLKSHSASMPPRPGNQGVIAYHALWATRRQAHGSDILSVLKPYGMSMPPRLAGRQGVIAYHSLWATRRQAHGSINPVRHVTIGVSIVMFERCCKQSQAQPNTHATAALILSDIQGSLAALVFRWK
jgi:hypothetical protein